jgi:ABC-2 type transport system permease protein
MRRHLRFLRLFWSAGIAAEMEYRLNFAIAALASLGSIAGSLFGLSLFYRNGYALGDGTWDGSRMPSS